MYSMIKEKVRFLIKIKNCLLNDETNIKGEHDAKKQMKTIR